jgi:hypothetical protein
VYGGSDLIRPVLHYDRGQVITDLCPPCRIICFASVTSMPTVYFLGSNRKHGFDFDTQIRPTISSKAIT